MFSLNRGQEGGVAGIKAVVVEKQGFRRSPQERREFSVETIVGQVQVLDAGQVPQLIGNLSAQVVGVEEQFPEIAQVAKFRRDFPGQLVALQAQLLQADQVPKFGRDLSAQVIGG